MSSATQDEYVQDTWQTPRNARTLQAFMALQNQDIADRLRELRKASGKPQTVVADALGVGERTYQTWELGEAKPSYRNLVKIAAYYGVSEEFILTGVDHDGAVATPDLLAKVSSAGQVDGGFDEFRGYVTVLNAKLDGITADQTAMQKLVDQQNANLLKQTQILENIVASQSEITAALVDLPTVANALAGLLQQLKSAGQSQRKEGGGA